MLVSNRTRWTAAITGCVTAITGLPILALGSLVLSGFLVLGALLVGRWPKHGRDLIWFGAGTVSLWAIPVSIGIMSLGGGRDPRVVAAAAITLAAVIWCDAVVITEAAAVRRAARTAMKSKF